MAPSSSTGPRATSPPADDAGSSISDGEYAVKVQKLIQLIDDLRALGAEAVIDLPGIAVIGNQSAGKSSLVEALSAISVPRNANTCTRCPMECRLKHSSKAWTCQVRLRRKCDTDLDGRGGRPERMDEANSNNPNGKQNAREETFGPLLTDKSELELMIRRAQLAVLNPTVSLSRFVGMSEKELDNGFADNDGQLQFSEDVVCLDITGPDVTNLSFVDLPGIISFDDEDNVSLVENMVKHHIKGNTLILLTITMRGVLTKPDTLQEGEEDLWLDILTSKGPNGTKYKLHHGYFVTKQPALAELKEKLGHSEARKRERTFFESTAPWNTLPARVRARMGVPRLTLDLSRLLSQLIEKSLPDLRKEASRSLSETQKALEALPPPPPENPVIELSRLLAVFTNDFNRYVWGATGYEELAQHCRRTYTTFMMDILSTRPNFVPQSEPLKLNGEVDMGRTELAFETIEEARGLPCESIPMFLDELHDFLEGSLTRELPYNVPFSAKAKLIRACFADWSKHCLKCVNAIKDTLRTLVLELVKSHYARYTRGGLEDHVRRIVESELDRCFRVTRERINWLLELEDPPFTKNDRYFASYRDTYLAQYKESRRQHKAAVPSLLPSLKPNMSSFSSFRFTSSSGQKEDATSESESESESESATTPEPTPKYAKKTRKDEVNEVLAGLARLGYVGKTEEDLAKLNDADPFEQELIVMAEVSAYFRIAYKRIIDNVPRVIDHDFLCALDKGMHDALNRGLGVGERDAYAQAESYLRDEPDVSAEREELTRKKERLEEIVERLDKFYV